MGGPACGLGRPRRPDATPQARTVASASPSEAERADYQRDLSVSYLKMGDLYRGLG